MKLVLKIENKLQELRKREKEAVVRFLNNGDLYCGDLYLSASAEYSMRLIDGMVPMLKMRNLVCASQLLRSQIGVCLRTYAPFVAENQEKFLEVAYKGGRIDKLKDKQGKLLSEGRLQDLLSEFDPRIKDVYRVTSGFVHFSMEILPAMSILKGDHDVEFNFCCEPNERNSRFLLECANAFCYFVGLHLEILNNVIASDKYYDISK